MVLELIANQSVEGSSASEFDPQLLRQEHNTKPKKAKR